MESSKGFFSWLNWEKWEGSGFSPKKQPVEYVVFLTKKRGGASVKSGVMEVDFPIWMGNQN